MRFLILFLISGFLASCAGDMSGMSGNSRNKFDYEKSPCACGKELVNHVDA